MATGYAHVNGVTYQLAGPVDSTVTSQMANRLRSGAGTEMLHVEIDGAKATITVQLAEVWASGAWDVEEPSHPAARAPRRIY